MSIQEDESNQLSNQFVLSICWPFPYINEYLIYCNYVNVCLIWLDGKFISSWWNWTVAESLKMVCLYMTLNELISPSASAKCIWSYKKPCDQTFHIQNLRALTRQRQLSLQVFSQLSSLISATDDVHSFKGIQDWDIKAVWEPKVCCLMQKLITIKLPCIRVSLRRTMTIKSVKLYVLRTQVPGRAFLEKSTDALKVSCFNILVCFK